MNIEVIEKEPVVDTPVTDTPVTDTPVTDTPVTVAPDEEQASAPPDGQADRPLLIDIAIDSESTALNVLVGFLNVAQRRGTFNFRESAKIGECIEMFVKGGQPASQ